MFDDMGLKPCTTTTSSSTPETHNTDDVILDDHESEMGSTESIRRMKMLVDYELDSKKHNKTRQYDRDAWNSFEFRTVEFEATGVSVQLRDYTHPFLRIDRMYFDNTIMGQAVQEKKAQYVCETKVAIGKRRYAKVQKPIAPTKSFCDIHLKVDYVHCYFNPAYLASIADFGRRVSSSLVVKIHRQEIHGSIHCASICTAVCVFRQNVSRVI